MHSFPLKEKRPQLYEQWMSAIPRDTANQTPSKSTKLCSKHFTPEDFISQSTDTNAARANVNFEGPSKKLKQR